MIRSLNVLYLTSCGCYPSALETLCNYIYIGRGLDGRFVWMLDSEGQISADLASVVYKMKL